MNERTMIPVTIPVDGTLTDIVSRIPPHIQPHNIQKMIIVAVDHHSRLSHVTYGVQPHEVNQILETLLYSNGNS